jgi:peptidyl-prolyl cis-trans isomerase B (cyclophilin B)
MRLKIVVLVALMVFMGMNIAPAYSEKSRHRNFTKQEIETMKEKKAVINTKFGEITLKFLPEVAPNHVNSFIELASGGFYNGTTFHRLVPGFVIQGGDPNTKSDDRSTHGMGGPGYNLKAEFSKLPHKRGTLSMARAADPDSAGSQFFICVEDTPFLDGQYTIFGEVVDGMDVVDQIVSQPRDPRDNPVDRIEMTVEIRAAESSG